MQSTELDVIMHLMLIRSAAVAQYRWDLPWEPWGGWFKSSKEGALVAGVPIHLLGKVTLSKVPNCSQGAATRLPITPNLHVYELCVCVVVFRAYVCKKKKKTQGINKVSINL